MHNQEEIAARLEAQRHLQARLDLHSSDDLMATLENAPPPELSTAVTILSHRKDPRATPVFRTLLATSQVGLVRNACALALLDLDDQARVPIIAHRLADPTTQGHRGTLIHALQGADVRHLLPLLTELILTDNFEVRCEALMRIEEMNGPVDANVVTTCLTRARTYRRGIDLKQGNIPHKLEVIDAVIDLFESS